MKPKVSRFIFFISSFFFAFLPFFSALNMQTKAAASISQITTWVSQEYIPSEWLTYTGGPAYYSTYAHYFLGRGISGLVYLYEATGNTAYIDAAIALANRHINAGVDTNSDGYLEWAAWPEAPGGMGTDVGSAMSEWRGNMGLATLLRYLATDPTLSSYSSYRNTLQQFMAVQVWDKWTFGAPLPSRDCDWIDQEWSVTHFVARCEYAALSLYVATGEQEYLDHITTRAVALRNAFTVAANNSYLIYDFMDGTGESIDLNHAADTVEFIVAAYKAGIVYNSTDITRLINTFKLNYWNGNLTTPAFKPCSDGSGSYLADGAGYGAFNMWALLSEYDSSIADIATNYYANGAYWSDDRDRVGMLGSLALGRYGKFVASSSSTTTSTSTSVSLPALTTTSGYTKYPITVDGVLNEGIWNVAPSITFSNSGRSNNTISVKSLWDDTNIYIAASVTDASLETTGGSEIYQDDAVEVFFDTLNNNSTSYDSDDYHAIVNIAGASYSATDTPTAYQTVTGGAGYVTEMRISWADLAVTPSQGLAMGYLVVNDDRDGGTSNAYDWIGMIDVFGQNFNRTDYWGTLTLATSTQKRGDYTFDDHVSLPDFAQFATRYKVTGIDCEYDLVGDNCYLDIADFQEFATNYGS